MSTEDKDFFVNRDGMVKNNKVSSKFIANAFRQTKIVKDTWMETNNILLFLLPLEVDGSSARTRLTAVLSEDVEVLVDAELPAALRPVQIVYSLYYFWYYFAQTQKTKKPCSRALWQGCALRKLKGSPVPWTCEIQGAQLDISMEKLRSSSRLGPQPCFENQQNKKRQIEELMGGRKEWMGIDSDGYQRAVT